MATLTMNLITTPPWGKGGVHPACCTSDSVPRSEMEPSVLAPSEAGEVEFLKDQVQRLSAVIAKYQKKYLPLDPPTERDDLYSTDGPRPVWLFNKSLLVPLLTEYDGVIRELTQQGEVYKSEIARLSKAVKQVTEDNTRMHEELRKTLEHQLQASPSHSLRQSGRGLDVDLVDHLHQQLDAVTQERNSYEGLARQSEEELKEIRKSHHDLSQTAKGLKEALSHSKAKEAEVTAVAQKLQEICQALEHEKQKLIATAQSQEAELSSIQESLVRCKADLQKETAKNGQMKKALDTITARLKRKEEDSELWRDHEKAVDERVHQLGHANASLESKLVATERELVLLREEKMDFEGKVGVLQGRISSLEEKEAEMLVHAKDSMQVAENAIMEKEQAQISERQTAQEIVRLKSVISGILDEAGERTRKEVDEVRAEYNKNVESMAEEIRQLELDCNEKQARLERALREKKAVSHELSKMQYTSPSQSDQYSAAVQQLQGQVRAAQREKDEAVVGQERLREAVKKMEERVADAKKKLVNVDEGHRSLEAELEREAEQLREEKLCLLQEVEVVRHQLGEEKRVRTDLQQRMDKEISSLTQTHELREVEVAKHLETVKQTHKQSVHKLRQDLMTQQRTSSRYREEVKSVMDKFERAVAEMKRDIDRHKHDNGVLSTDLARSRAAQQSLEEEVSRLSSSLALCQERLAESESQCDEALGQVATLLSREKQLREERRALQQQVDRVRLEMSRNLGLGVTDPTNTSGLGLSATLRPTSGLGTGAGRWNVRGGGAVSLEGGADPTLDALLASAAAERKKRRLATSSRKKSKRADVRQGSDSDDCTSTATLSQGDL